MTRYERVLELAEKILAAVKPKAKARGDVERFVSELRASKTLPAHCEWAARADDWHVTGGALKLFEQLEDLVNFHPVVVRAGVYDEEDEEEDYEAQAFVTQFSSQTLCIQWQIDLDHEEEVQGDITPDFGFTLMKDGAKIDEGTWDSTIESSWSNSSHSFSRGDDEPGEWKSGAYVLHFMIWGEPLATVEFTIVEGDAKPPPIDDKNRFERIAALTREAEAALAKSVKKKDHVVARLEEIRRMCAERALPKQCDWVEEAEENWSVRGRARKIFERMEDLASFHPKLLRIGFFDAKEEAKFERPLVTRFDCDIDRIEWQIEIDHEDEQYGTVPIEWRWRWTNPDGTINEGVIVSHVENAWGNSFHHETFMRDEGDETWPVGRHTLTISLWDESFAEVTVQFDSKEKEIDAL